MKNTEDFFENGTLVISGEQKITGEINLQGDKVAAVHLLFAALLVNEKSIIHHLPFCGDILSILEWSTKHKIAGLVFPKNGSLEIHPAPRFKPDITHIAKMRGSICMVSALALKYGYVAFPEKVNGCNFTHRPVERHITLIESFGIKITLKDGVYLGTKNEEVTRLDFDCSSAFGPSIGLTVHALIASIYFEGELYLKNTALEPVISLLTAFVSNYKSITVNGRNINIYPKTKSEPHHNTIYIPDDYTAAFTYLCATMTSVGHCYIKYRTPFPPTLIRLLEKMEMPFSADEKGIEINAKSFHHPDWIECNVWPSVPSDIGPIVSAGLCKKAGTTTITDFVYDRRSAHVNGLNKMGYNVSAEGNIVTINGSSPHKNNTTVEALDIRTGAALLVGALGRHAETAISNADEMFRGYENLPDMLNALNVNFRYGDDKNLIRLKALQLSVNNSENIEA